MKYLLLFVLLAVVFYKLTGRRNERPAERKPSAPPPPQAMIRCARCGMHLPADEAGRRQALKTLIPVELEWRLHFGEPARVEEALAALDRGYLI